MLAHGSILYDVKNQFLRKKNRKNKPGKHVFPEGISKQPKFQGNNSAAASRPPLYSTRNNFDYPPPKAISDVQNEVPFKWVRKALKLNQSAMTPNKQQQTDRRLENLAEKSDHILLKISSVFPFTFFVNDITVDPFKVNIIFRNFFWSEQIHSVMIRDILDVVVETSVFFATLKIVDQGYTENSIVINYLWKKDALEARKIIQGLIIAHRQGIDMSTPGEAGFKSNVENIGRVKEIDGTEDEETIRNKNP